MRDDRPFPGPTPPAAVFYDPRDRTGEHPQRHLQTYAGILQADAYGGYNKLYEEGRRPGLVLEAARWVHARRKFFVLADLAASARRKAQGKTPAVISPIALEAVRRIDALFAIERQINGQDAARRKAVRHEFEPRRWRPSWKPDTAGAYLAVAPQRRRPWWAMIATLKRWPAFTRFLNDGRIRLSNNAAERALRGIALGRRAWLSAGSDRGGDRAAFMCIALSTAKMNDIDPQAGWLADVLRRIADHPASRLHELLPWNWRIARQLAAQGETRAA